MAQYAEEERQIREENVRLQRKLQLEIDRREQLCRHLSESESSLEMDDERSVHFSDISCCFWSKQEGAAVEGPPTIGPSLQLSTC